MTMKKISIMIEDMETGDRVSHLFQLEDRDRNGRCRSEIGAWITDAIHLENAPITQERWSRLLKPATNANDD